MGEYMLCRMGALRRARSWVQSRCTARGERRFLARIVLRTAEWSREPEREKSDGDSQEDDSEEQNLARHQFLHQSVHVRRHGRCELRGRLVGLLRSIWPIHKDDNFLTTVSELAGFCAGDGGRLFSLRRYTRAHHNHDRDQCCIGRNTHSLLLSPAAHHGTMLIFLRARPKRN